MAKIIYLNAATTISPYNPAGHADRLPFGAPRLRCIEPDYKDYIDPRLIRRMSRVVKMGTAAAIACLREAGVDMPGAILTGTAYGCTEDTEAFLQKLVAQNEEMLTPTAFIQSTHNTIGAQIALLLQCHAYNNTYVHRAFSFEHALLDAMLLLQENEAVTALVGGVDEMPDTSFRILSRFDLYKKTIGENTPADPEGTIAGEGAAFFLLSKEKTEQTLCRMNACATFFKPENMAEEVIRFLSENQLQATDIDLVYLGKNGDCRYDDLYDALTEAVFPGTPVAGFKHLCGEYPVATAFASWLAAQQFKTPPAGAAISNMAPAKRCHQPKHEAGDISEQLPVWEEMSPHLRRDDTSPGSAKPRNILIYNHFYNMHHSLILLSAC